MPSPPPPPTDKTNYSSMLNDLERSLNLLFAIKLADCPIYTYDNELFVI